MDEAHRADFINEHFYTFYSNSYDQAVVLGEEALAISQKNKIAATEALSLKNLGIVHYLKGNYEQALDFYQQSLDRYESLKDPAGQGNVLREMANYFKKTGQHDKALENMDEAIRLCTEAGDTSCLTASLDIQGVVFLETGRLEEAQANFTKELALLKRTGDEKALSYTLDNLAAIATERSLFDQAIRLLQQSLDIRQRLDDEHGVAIIINNLGEALLRAGQPEKALPYFRDALQKSEAIGFNDLRRHVMQMLSVCYTGTGEYSLAMQWLQKSYALKDSLFNEQRSRQLAEMSTKYATEKKERELAQTEAQLQRRNTFLAVSFLGTAVLALVFGFVFRQQKTKQRQIQREAGLKAEIARSELSNRLQEERLRISRDLHDNLGAELTIIGSALSRKAFQAASEGEKQELEAIGKNARQAMSQLRETIWAIRQEQFSVKQLAEKTGDFAVRATSLPVNILVPELEILLTPAQTLNLYRIAQEAITNAVKYAGATDIRVVFEVAEKSLKMVVKDNGEGFNTYSSSNGNGLVNMRSRIQELGGKLSILSGKDGTTLTAQLPVSP